MVSVLTKVRFVVHSAIVGLAIAFVIVVFRPELITPPPGVEAASPTGATSYADAVRAAAPAVVNIHTSRVVKRRVNPLLEDAFLRRFFNRPENVKDQVQSDLGSGVIFGSNGVVVTNHHVVARADDIRVMLQDGRSARARVIGTDPDTDLAILQIPLDNLPSIALGSAESIEVGDIVLAIGNPFGVGQTVTMGIVSAKGRSRLGINTFEDFIQTDAAINPGNSGGALISPDGQLIGINTAILSETGQASGIGFAIPVDVARHVTDQILTNGFVKRGWLGIEVEPLNSREAARRDLAENAPGVLVNRVLARGPAAQAGLLPGDLITAVEGQLMLDPQMAVNAISAVAPGAKVRLTVLRSGKERQLTAVVSQRPS